MRDVQENLDVLPSDSNLAGAEIELLDVENKESVLNGYLETIRDQYDFIIIDCPPSLSLLTINALVAADTVLVPIQCEYYALEGLSQVLRTIGLVRKKMNPSLELEGVVFTMYDARSGFTRRSYREMCDWRRRRATECRSTCTTAVRPVQRATVCWQQR